MNNETAPHVRVVAEEDKDLNILLKTIASAATATPVVKSFYFEEGDTNVNPAPLEIVNKEDTDINLRSLDVERQRHRRLQLER